MADLYFVGSTNGNWSNAANWRVGSYSGAVSGAVPGVSDNVFINNLAINALVINSAFTVNDFNLIGEYNVDGQSITSSGITAITIRGNFNILWPPADWNVSANVVINLTTATTVTISTEGYIAGSNPSYDKTNFTLRNRFNINKLNGTATFLTNFDNLRDLVITNGEIYFNPDLIIKIAYFSTTTTSAKNIYFNNTTFALGVSDAAVTSNNFSINNVTVLHNTDTLTIDVTYETSLNSQIALENYNYKAVIITKTAGGNGSFGINGTPTISLFKVRNLTANQLFLPFGTIAGNTKIQSFDVVATATNSIIIRNTIGTKTIEKLEGGYINCDYLNIGQQQVVIPNNGIWCAGPNSIVHPGDSISSGWYLNCKNKSTNALPNLGIG